MQYRLAVECNPDSAEALGSYASFLHGVRGQKELAESHYEVLLFVSIHKLHFMLYTIIFVRVIVSSCHRVSALFKQMPRTPTIYAITDFSYLKRNATTFEPKNCTSMCMSKVS